MPVSDFALSPQLNSQDVYWHYNPGPEVYARKVFVGGLPIDTDEGTFAVCGIFCGSFLIVTACV